MRRVAHQPCGRLEDLKHAARSRLQRAVPDSPCPCCSGLVQLVLRVEMRCPRTSSYGLAIPPVCCQLSQSYAGQNDASASPTLCARTI